MPRAPRPGTPGKSRRRWWRTASRGCFRSCFSATDSITCVSARSRDTHPATVRLSLYRTSGRTRWHTTTLVCCAFMSRTRENKRAHAVNKRAHACLRVHLPRFLNCHECVRTCARPRRKQESACKGQCVTRADWLGVQNQTGADHRAGKRGASSLRHVKADLGLLLAALDSPSGSGEQGERRSGGAASRGSGEQGRGCEFHPFSRFTFAPPRRCLAWCPG